jgi:hypothetical protein
VAGYVWVAGYALGGGGIPPPACVPLTEAANDACRYQW